MFELAFGQQTTGMRTVLPCVVSLFLPDLLLLQVTVQQQIVPMVSL